MSDARIEPNHNERPRRRKRSHRQRTTKWYHDSNIGTEEGGLNSTIVSRFFISTAEDEPPEIFFIPMARDFVQNRDGSAAMKSTYAGDIEKNQIPLSTMDIEALYNTLVTMKARLIRMQAEFRGKDIPSREPSLKEPAPTVQRTVQRTVQEKPKLADELKGW